MKRIEADMRDPDDRLEKRILERTRELVEENRKLSIAMDESSRLRALESKLFQAARLDAVAAAAAALAHELRSTAHRRR
jgi:C4-dicarboxylate-specific signal transduction histidine kinase